MYILLLLLVIIAVSVVSAIIEPKPFVKNAARIFVNTSIGIAVLALVVFFLSK